MKRKLKDVVLRKKKLLPIVQKNILEAKESKDRALLQQQEFQQKERLKSQNAAQRSVSIK